MGQSIITTVTISLRKLWVLDESRDQGAHTSHEAAPDLRDHHHLPHAGGVPALCLGHHSRNHWKGFKAPGNSRKHNRHLRSGGQNQGFIQRSSLSDNNNNNNGKRKIIINLIDVYHCPSTGVFPIDGDCKRFLLCRKDRRSSEKIRGKVYKCPKGYLFSNIGARCKHEDDVACHRSSPLTRFRKSQPANHFFLMP